MYFHISLATHSQGESQPGHLTPTADEETETQISASQPRQNSYE